MDCFIIRVYRHIAQEDGQPDEIAGLVERVGRQDNGRPFSSYKSLIRTLREEYAGVTAEAIPATAPEAGGMRLVRTAKPR
jgi:hypothetical protein